MSRTNYLKSGYKFRIEVGLNYIHLHFLCKTMNTFLNQDEKILVMQDC